MKLCLAYNNSSHCLHRQCEPTTTSVNLLEQQFLLSLSRQIEDQLDSWRNGNAMQIHIFFNSYYFDFNVNLLSMQRKPTMKLFMLRCLVFTPVTSRSQTCTEGI